MNTDATVKSFQKISDTAGSFTGTLDDNDLFGLTVTGLGDLDNDGVEDLAVGAYQDDDGGAGRGAVWVLFLNSNGTVKGHQKISDLDGSFTGTPANADSFGISVAPLGDLDRDGKTDLAVGAFGDDDGSIDRGAVWVLFMNTDGMVKSHQKISDTAGGFTGTLDDTDLFGRSVGALGDLDSDGVEDLAVGAYLDDDGGTDRGAVWVLFMNTDGTVKSHQKISDKAGSFTGTLDDSDVFGITTTSLGDLDGDGVTDLAVGAVRQDDGGTGRGAAWILFMNTDGTVKNAGKISDTAGELTDSDKLGIAVTTLGDLDSDGVTDLAVGASLVDDGVFSGPYMPAEMFGVGDVVLLFPGDFDGDFEVDFQDFVKFAVA